MSHPPYPYPYSRTKPACCACKHQRRRCTPDCLLAPHFPPHKISDFTNVHKLFGINNVQKLLKKIAPSHREDAVKSLSYEANLRAANPVGGCCTVILELERQIHLCTAELNAVYKQLAVYKPQFYTDHQYHQEINHDWEEGEEDNMMFFKNNYSAGEVGTSSTSHPFWDG